MSWTFDKSVYFLTFDKHLAFFGILFEIIHWSVFWSIVLPGGFYVTPESSLKMTLTQTILTWISYLWFMLIKRKLRMQMWRWKDVINSQETLFFVLTQLQNLDKFTCCPSGKSEVYFLYPVSSCVNISLLIITWGFYNIPQLIKTLALSSASFV